MAKIEIYKQKLLVVNGTPAELEKITPWSENKAARALRRSA